MSHEKMLQMFSEIILCFADADAVSLTQLEVSENRYRKFNYYEPHMFTINVKSKHMAEEISVYKNITIIH